MHQVFEVLMTFETCLYALYFIEAWGILLHMGINQSGDFLMCEYKKSGLGGRRENSQNAVLKVEAV